MSSFTTRSKLKMASVGDVHLGHPKNPTWRILENLSREFPDNAETASLDAIWIVGDFFDDLLAFTGTDETDIFLWVSNFLRLCKKHNIIVRILKGTPSHDWDQPQVFLTINELAQIGANIKYVRDLSVEYIEELGIRVLYVPDEWETTTEKTLSQIRELFRAKGIDRVDYALMHGQFDFQLPEHVKAQKHDSEAYLDLVSGLIFIGHVHTSRFYKRILPCGSFDRLAHNEEEAKGHVRVTAHENGEHDIKFVENKRAMKFITVCCLGLSLEDTLNKVEMIVSGLEDGSHVRIEAETTNPILNSMEILIRKFPLYNWSKIARDLSVQEEESEAITEAVFVPITITKDNIVQLLMDRLLNNGSSQEILEGATRILDEVK